MISNKMKRIRRAKSFRFKITRESNKLRLCVHKTSRHIYAQVISSDGSKILASASTLELQLKSNFNYSGNIVAAKFIGKIIAERSVLKGISCVFFDRSGFKYHGRIKALADSARSYGLNF